MFDLLTKQEDGEETKPTFRERANLSAEFGRTQIACGSGKPCGGCTDFLLDGRGRPPTLPSDGMGSGGKAAIAAIAAIAAAVTVSLLVKLIGAGSEFDAALKMVNSALLVKSNEKSLSTVDIACADPFTGRTDSQGGRCTYFRASLRQGGRGGVDVHAGRYPAGRGV